MIRETIVQTILSLAILCLSMLVALVGAGFLVAGLYLYLGNWLPPEGAAAATGGVLLLAALFMLLICKAMLSAKSPAPPSGAEQARKNGSTADLLKDAEALSRMSGHLESTIREHFPVVAGSAFAAGFFLGVSPDARHSLGKALSDAAAASNPAAKEKR